MKTRSIILLVLASALGLAQSSQPPLPEPQRSQWFQDAKFGMFIHWGAYSVIGRHEWSREQYQIPQAEYDKYVRQFNPIHYNPDAWVDLAKNAGAKYMVITSKHHDGFSIYRSEVSDYDMKLTSYPGDPLKMLADACKRKGMRLGFYHSIMDWHNADYIPKREWEHPGQNKGGNIDRYIETFMKPQLKELLTRYGDVSVIWFDGGWEHSTSEMHSQEVFDYIHSLQPNTLINDRIFNGEPGNPANYGTPEQHVPATGMKTKDGKAMNWESCVTINDDSWGYNKYETQFKTSRDLIRMLIEVVSKGGNLLLNVGPRPDGTIQPEFVSRLNAMGEWMKVNGDAIYGTTASPFERLPFFGRATRKGNTIYLHVFQWPANRQLRVPGLANSVVSAQLLADEKTKLTSHRDGADLIVDLPDRAPDDVASVVAITLDSAPKVTRYLIRPESSGVVRLGAENGEIETTFEQRAKKENFLGHVFLADWVRGEDYPSWTLSLPQPGKYKLELTYGAGRASAGSEFTVVTQTQELKGTVNDTGNGLVFKSFEIGSVDLPAGEQTLQVISHGKQGVAFMQLEYVKLTPQ